MKKTFHLILLFQTSLFSQINISENELFSDYFGNEEYDLVYKKTDEILEKGNHREKITANLIKANYILYKDDTKKAFQYIEKAKTLLDIKKDPINLYVYYYNEALYYMYERKSFERLNSIVKAVKIKKEYNIIDSFFLIEYNLIDYYLGTENYPKVLSISNSVINQLKNNKIKYSSIKSAMFRFNAIASRNIEKYDVAKEYLDSAMFYAKYYNDSTQIARVTKYQADLFLDIKQYDQAFKTTLKAEKLFKKHDTKNINVIYSLLGYIYFEKKQYDEAKKYLKKALDDDILYLSDYIKTSQYYRTILEKENKIEQAYLTMIKEDSIRNAISGQSVDSKILNLELDYKEFQNKAILQKNKERIWWFIYILAFSLISIGLLSFSLYQRSINIKKLKNHQKKIEKANKKLKKVNFKLNKFGKIVSHDLKAPIHSIGSLATFIEEDEPQLSENSKKYLNLIHESVMTTENLILNMLTFAQSENNIIEKKHVTFDEIIEQIKINLFYDINRSKANIVVHNKPEFIYGKKILLTQFFQNFIQNSIKYRDENRPLIINIDYHAFEKKITLQDNGIGIHSDDLNKLFRAYNQQSFESIDRGIGLGLYIIKNIAELHDITIKIDSNINEGTLISLFFNENYIE